MVTKGGHMRITLVTRQDSHEQRAQYIPVAREVGLV